jgi:hypothetical protein
MNEKKKLISIGSIAEMWSNLKHFCKLISIDDSQLLTTKSVFTNSTNRIQANDLKQTASASNTANNVNTSNNSGINMPLTPHPSSSSYSSTSSSSSTSSFENLNENTNGHQRSSGHKRPSSGSLLDGSRSNNSNNKEVDEPSSAKILKLDSHLSSTPSKAIFFKLEFKLTDSINYFLLILSY